MGAKQSYLIPSQPADITRNVFQELNSITQQGTTQPVNKVTINDEDLIRYIINLNETLFKLQQDCQNAGAEYQTILPDDKKKIQNLVNDIEQLNKLYILFNNYKVKNKIINKDLKKKYNNESGNIKLLEQNLDKLQYNTLNINHKINSKLNKKKVLNIIIILTIIANLILLGLLIKKLIL